MNRTEKKEVVAALADRFAKSPNFYLTDFTGISVKGITDLRRRFLSNGAEFVVAKNTLALRAMKEASVTGVEGVLAGPTGFVFAGADPVTAAKVLADFQKGMEQRPAVKAGVVDGRPVGPEDVKRLAALPTKEELLGQIAGAMQAPLQGLLGAMDGVLYQFAGVLESLRAQREGAA